MVKSVYIHSIFFEVRGRRNEKPKMHCSVLGERDLSLKYVVLENLFSKMFQDQSWKLKLSTLSRAETYGRILEDTMN